MDIHVIYCNRKELWNEKRTTYPKGCRVMVWDGGSNEANQLNTTTEYMYSLNENIKEKYPYQLDRLYHTFKGALKQAISSPHQRDILIIEDDCGMHPMFLELIEKYKSQIPTDRFIINPLVIPNRDAYYYSGKRTKDFSNDLFETGWIDGNYFLPYQIAVELNKYLGRFNKRPPFKKSSGIGILISRYCVKNNIRIFMPKTTLLEHGDHDSVLFGERRKAIPMIAKFI